jgi:hypothetical protein
MVDYKKAALTGAAVGLVASFFMGKKTRGLNLTKLATYAGTGALAVVGGSFAMAEVAGRPLAMFARTGWEEGEAMWDRHHRPIGHEHFHRW